MLGSIGDATACAVRHTKSGLEGIRLPWSMRLPDSHFPRLDRVVIWGSQGPLLNRVVVVRGHREHLHRARTMPSSIELVSVPGKGGRRAIKPQQLSTNDVLCCKVRTGTFLGCKRVTFQRWYEEPPRLARHEPQEAVITRCSERKPLGTQPHQAVRRPSIPFQPPSRRSTPDGAATYREESWSVERGFGRRAVQSSKWGRVDMMET